MKKKLFVVLLSLVMVMTMMPLSVFADGTKASTNHKNTVSSKTENVVLHGKTFDEDEGQVIYDPSNEDLDYLSFRAVDADMELSSSSAFVTEEHPFQYSTDKVAWKVLPMPVVIEKGTTIYLRLDKTVELDESTPFGKFEMNGVGTIEAGGNCMSLLDPTLEKKEVTYPGFAGLFNDCKPLTKAPKLPATKFYRDEMNEGPTYRYMFADCSNLVEAPELPATELNSECYMGMFRSCENLVKAPDLPANSVGRESYGQMFMDCSSLVNPPVISATHVGDLSCENMFAGCTSLTNAPELSAISGGEECYMYMFQGCTNLTKAPSTLPITDLPYSGYWGMFKDCTKLTKAPYLPATSGIGSSSCYYEMFSGCSSLNHVDVDFNNWEDSNSIGTTDWLKGVAQTGTFVCPETLDTSIRDASHVPAGWTIKHPSEPPVIPEINSLKAKALNSKTCSITWNPLTQFDNVRYEIFRGTTITGSWTKIGDTSNNSFMDSTVTTGNKYYYMIRPIVTIDGREYKGPYSNKDYGYPRINALTGFSAWASDYKTANVSWSKALDEDAEFWIYRGTKPTGDWGSVHAKVTKEGATSWSETVAPGQKYYYMVRVAVKGHDGKYYFGPYTKVDYAYPRLTVPSNFKAWASDKTTCKCSWSKLPGENVQYLVYRGTKPTGNWGNAIATVNTNSFTDSGKTPGQKYYYMVRAKVTVNGKTYFSPYTKVDYGYPR